MVEASDSKVVERALETLAAFGTVLSVKLYRLKLDPPPPVPVIPCLDHEAMLHQRVDPHAAAYVQERASGDLHEVAVIPARRRIQVDTISTWDECSPQSHRRLLEWLAASFPDYRIGVTRHTWWRGDERVAGACRAQVSLREVLLGADIASVEAGIERLRTIGALMEKQSRVASWAVRTVTGPILAASGVLTYQLLGLFTVQLGEGDVNSLRYAVLSGFGGVFLYYGLKAVHLTEMSNRIWKRSAEYGLILKERRKRLSEPPVTPMRPS